MTYGYNGRIAHIDLSAGTVGIEEPDESFYRTYLGGWGFITYYLLRETPRGLDPLGPDNRLIFATGPVTGVPLAGSGRNAVGAKSPLTGAFGASEVGGYFGAELKHAGVDALVISGQAAQPVYLWVHDGQVEIRDAGRAWGLSTGDALDVLLEDVGDKRARAALIGPGGERLVRYACVMNDLSHAAGRTGMGAVMGSKKLKAVVARGTHAPELADPDTIKAMAKDFLERWKDESYAMHDTGTAGMLKMGVVTGNLPTRNFGSPQEGDFSGLTGEALRDKYLVGRGSCFACPIHCKREVKLDEPCTVEQRYGGPEYETLAALGSDCGVEDLAAILKANEICAASGVDTISTGATIAFAMECFERGLLTVKETDGLELRFGDPAAMLAVLEMIVKRSGIGDLLAEGSKRAAERIGKGAEQYAIQVKGQEFPMHEPRIKWGLGLGYAVSPTGADHCHSVMDTAYMRGKNVDKIKSLGILKAVPATDLSPDKVRLLFYSQQWGIVSNNLVLCNFTGYSYEQIQQMVDATTGWQTSAFELMKIGERALTLARVFNVREGFGPQDDVLPVRFTNEPFTTGPAAGHAPSRDQIETAKRLYYEMMGWDGQGVPTAGKLAELGVHWAHEVIAAR